MAAAPDFSGTLVIGDQNKNVYFVNADGTNPVHKLTLLNGNMAVLPASLGELVIIGENHSDTTSAVYGYNARTLERKFGIENIKGRIESPIVISSDCVLYISTSRGILYAIDTGSRQSAEILWELDVLNLSAGEEKKVTANLLSNDEKQIYLVTANGIYGIKLNEKKNKGEVIWSAEKGKSFIQAVPILNNQTIFAACGNIMYAFDTSYKLMNHELASKWSYIADHKILNPINVDCMHLIFGDESGDFHTLDMDTGNRISMLVNPGLTKEEIYQSILAYGDRLISLSAGNRITATRILLTSELGMICEVVWKKTINGAAFTGYPAVVRGMVLAVDNTGTLYAFNLSDGTQLWTIKLEAGITSLFSTPVFVPLVSKDMGAVRFLLDGRNYFSTMKNLLIAAKNGDLSNGSVQVDTPTFEKLVTAVGESGKKVYILMWKPSQMSKLVMGEVEVNYRTEEVLKGKNNVNVYMEPYTEYQADWESFRDWIAADLGVLAQHQKIAVFCIEGTKFALVSGMNISSSDWDKKTHPMDEIKEEINTYNGRHDSGVLLQGPIVDAVEKEFDRRWGKSGNPSTNPGTATYVKMGLWAIQHDMNLDGTLPSAYTNPTITEEQIPVKVLTTNFDDSSNPVRLIRDNIIQEINNAQDYIYMENFTMHDVSITQALADKLADSTSSCKIIIMLPHPPVGEAVQGKYIKYVYIILHIMSGAWEEISYYEPSYLSSIDFEINCDKWILKKVRKSEIAKIDIEFGKISMNTVIKYKLKGEDYEYNVPVNNVTSFTAEEIKNDSRLIYCSPARYFTEVQSGNENNILKGWNENYRGIYIHSKMALFDDKKALIGSANFNNRSMKYDGEMSVLIEDFENVSSIRNQLFQHWNMDKVGNWVSKMQKFQSNPDPGVGILPLKYDALVNFEPRKLQNIPRDFLERYIYLEDFM